MDTRSFGVACSGRRQDWGQPRAKTASEHLASSPFLWGAAILFCHQKQLGPFAMRANGPKRQNCIPRLCTYAAQVAPDGLRIKSSRDETPRYCGPWQLGHHWRVCVSYCPIRFCHARQTSVPLATRRHSSRSGPTRHRNRACNRDRARDPFRFPARNR